MTEMFTLSRRDQLPFFIEEKERELDRLKRELQGPTQSLSKERYRAYCTIKGDDMTIQYTDSLTGKRWSWDFQIVGGCVDLRTGESVLECTMKPIVSVERKRPRYADMYSRPTDRRYDEPETVTLTFESGEIFGAHAVMRGES